MAKGAVDLFDDPPWTTEVRAAPRAPAARAPLIGTLVLVVLYLASMALPWFTSGETPPWTPFSPWLNRGWAPGTQKWGFLLLALATALAVAIGLTIRTSKRALFGVLPLLASALFVMTVLETSAHLSVDPGPLLQADIGAWIGDGLALGALIAATAAAIRRVAATRQDGGAEPRRSASGRGLRPVTQTRR